MCALEARTSPEGKVHTLGRCRRTAEVARRPASPSNMKDVSVGCSGHLACIEGDGIMRSGATKSAGSSRNPQSELRYQRFELSQIMNPNGKNFSTCKYPRALLLSKSPIIKSLATTVFMNG